MRLIGITWLTVVGFWEALRFAKDVFDLASLFFKIGDCVSDEFSYFAVVTNKEASQGFKDLILS